MQKIYQEFNDKGLELVAINGMDDKKTIRDYITKNHFTFKIGLTGKKVGAAYDIADKYGVQAYPTNFLMDPSGKVLWRGVGFDEKELRTALSKAGIK